MSPRTRNAAQAQDTERADNLRELMRLFYPALVRTSQIPQSLDQMRYDLWRDVVKKLLQAAASNDSLYTDIRENLLPKNLQSLDKHRETILAVFISFERICYESRNGNEMSVAMGPIADRLRQEMAEIEQFDTHSTPMQANFIIGILIMVLNEVAKLGQNTHPWRRYLYGLLMHANSNLQPRLKFSHIDAWSEVEWKEYSFDVQLLVLRFTALGPDLIAPGNVMRELEKVLPKILPADVNDKSILIAKAREAAASENVESPSPGSEDDSESDDEAGDDEEGDREESMAEQDQDRDESSEEASDSADER